MVVRARALMCHELRYRLRQLIICTFSICVQSCVPCETAVCSLLSVKSHRLLSRDLFAFFFHLIQQSVSVFQVIFAPQAQSVNLARKSYASLQVQVGRMKEAINRKTRPTINQR
jgi:hypothetical protein